MNIYAEHYGMRMTPYTDSNTIPRTLPTPRSKDAEGKPNWKHSFGCFGLFDDDDGVTGLYPVSLVIEDAEVKTHYQDIPGSDGAEDWTEALTGTAHYGNRAGTFRFKFIGPRNLWKTVYHHLMSIFHGQRCAIILDEDRAGYYYGRFAVEKPEQAEYATYFTITADLYPYQMDFMTAAEDWLFDPLYIAEPALPQAGLGIIRGYEKTDMPTSAFPQEYTYIASPLPQHPVIYVYGEKLDSATQQWVPEYLNDGDITVTYTTGKKNSVGGDEVHEKALKAGDEGNTFDDVVLVQRPYHEGQTEWKVWYSFPDRGDPYDIRAKVKVDFETGRL